MTAALRFWIDGEAFDLHGGDWAACNLLSVLARVDDATHELAQVGPDGQPGRRYSGEAIVPIDDGDRFVTVYTGPTP